MKHQLPRVKTARGCILFLGLTSLEWGLRRRTSLKSLRHLGNGGGGPSRVCLLHGVHGLVEAQQDREVRSALNRAGLATTDGMPLVWWCRLSGFSDAERICGTDFLPAMCEATRQRGYRHYFYGGSPRVVEKLVSRLTQRYPGLVVAGYRSPPFHALTQEEDAADIEAINKTRPDFVWVRTACRNRRNGWHGMSEKFRRLL